MAQMMTQMILWCDSDRNVEHQGDIIKTASYDFKYFASTKELITFYKMNGPKIDICGIITSSLQSKPNGDRSGIEMINYLKGFTPSMRYSNPIFAICSCSIKHDKCTNLISSNRDEIQQKVIDAIKQNQHKQRNKCKAKGCNDNHSNHYCKLCDKYDSDHRAMECPEGKELYHGTKAEHFNSIINLCDGSLFKTKDGRLGEGVYFTPNADHAAIIGKDWHSNKSGYMVLSCKVYLGKTKYLKINEADHEGSWHQDYNSCFGFHCTWLSFKNGECEEYVIKDVNKFRISKVTLFDCHIDEDIFAPRLVIKLINSTINMKRNITVGGWE